MRSRLLAFVLGALLGTGPLWADLQRFGGGSGGPISTTTGTFSTSVTVGTTTTAGTATCVIDSAMGGASATDNFLNCTGTFPATLSAIAKAAVIAPTFATQNQRQVGLDVRAVNSGGNITVGSGAGVFVNNQQGTGTTYMGAFDSQLTVPVGLYAEAAASSAATVAMLGYNSTNVGGATSIGIVGYTTNTNSHSAAIWGNALDAAGGSNVGGYFTLGGATTTPTLTDAALLADNGTVAAPIFIARDNGTAVFTIADGGITTKTAAMRAEDGSGAAPSYSFTNASQHGMYFVNPPGIAFSIGGTPPAGINSTGYVVTSGAQFQFLSGTISASADAGFERQAAGVMGSTNGSTGEGWIQNEAGDQFLTADVTNATTTFANLTDLTVTVVSGRKYSFEMALFVAQSTAADGAKLDFNGGTATSTNFVAHCHLVNAVGATLTQANATSAALATSINIAAFTDTNVHRYHCVGSFEPSGNGTFIPRQAENAASAGSITWRRGSFLHVKDMP